VAKIGGVVQTNCQSQGKKQVTSAGAGSETIFLVPAPSDKESGETIIAWQDILAGPSKVGVSAIAIVVGRPIAYDHWAGNFIIHPLALSY
jgi:hypothetical protein